MGMVWVYLPPETTCIPTAMSLPSPQLSASFQSPPLWDNCMRNPKIYMAELPGRHKSARACTMAEAFHCASACTVTERS
jgi:hypothetical protein